MSTSKLASFIVKFRFLLFALSLLFYAWGAIQLPKMVFDGDFTSMFPKDDPYLEELEKIDETYLQSRNLIILVQPPNKDMYSRESLELIQKITEEAWKLPYSIRVDSLTNYQHAEVDGDNFFVGNLINEPATLTKDALRKIESIIESDINIMGRLISDSGQVSVIIVSLALPDVGPMTLETLQTSTAASELLDAANDLRDIFVKQYPGVVIHFTGEPALEQGLLDVSISDMMTLSPAMSLVVIVLIWIFLRSLVAVISVLAVLSITQVIAFGIALQLGYYMNPVTVLAPMLIMVLAIADSVHILSQYIIHLREGKEKPQAMEAAIDKNFSPVLLTSITTGIGLLALNFGDSPYFADMGTISAIGVFVAFIITFTVIPTIALFIPMKLKREALFLTPLLLQLARWVVKNNKVIFWVSIVTSLTLISFIPATELNDDLDGLLDESVEVQKSVRFAHKHLGGFRYILYSFESGEPGGVNEPAYLHHIDSFANWLRQQPEVSSISSYIEILKSLNKAMHNNDSAYYTVPNNRMLAAQYMALYEMSLPVGSDLSQVINNNRSSLRITVNLNHADNKAIIALEQRAGDWMNIHMKELYATPTSGTLMFAHFSMNSIYGMIDGSLLALAFITIVLIVGLKSIRYGLLSIVPNLAPAAIVYGIWSMVLGEVNQAAAFTFCLSLGLIVDDTVHMLSKYLYAKREGKNTEDAIYYAFTSSGTALIVTTLALAAGMFLMTLSLYTPTGTMGMMMALIILTAILFDFIFLPTLLMRFDRQTEESKNIHEAEQTVEDSPSTELC
ncbi:MAG: hypothetical protein COA99_01980 [Moraxellaceae bacterium]|nr:MAG: hypothetical protein COA99_01980 [Moraxellaceae bacterium]